MSSVPGVLSKAALWAALLFLIRPADITANWIYAAVRDEATYPDALEAVKKGGRVVLSYYPFGSR